MAQICGKVLGPPVAISEVPPLPAKELVPNEAHAITASIRAVFEILPSDY